MCVRSVEMPLGGGEDHSVELRNGNCAIEIVRERGVYGTRKGRSVGVIGFKKVKKGEERGEKACNGAEIHRE